MVPRLLFVDLLVSEGCHSRAHKLGDRKQDTLLSHSLEAGSLRSMCRQGPNPLKAPGSIIPHLFWLPAWLARCGVPWLEDSHPDPPPSSQVRLCLFSPWHLSLGLQMVTQTLLHHHKYICVSSPLYVRTPVTLDQGPP